MQGFLCGFVLADASTRQLAALFVHPDFQHDTIGWRLHCAAVDWLFRIDKEAISLTIPPYAKAYKFFAFAGWKLVDADANGRYLMALDALTWRARRRRYWRGPSGNLRRSLRYLRRNFLS